MATPKELLYKWANQPVKLTLKQAAELVGLVPEGLRKYTKLDPSKKLYLRSSQDLSHKNRLVTVDKTDLAEWFAKKEYGHVG